MLLPYLYMLLLGFGLLAVTSLIEVLQTLMASNIHVFGWKWSPNGLKVVLLYLINLLSQIGADASGPVAFSGCFGRRHRRRSVVGRRALRITVVFQQPVAGNVVYGSLTGVIIALLSLEAASLIILLGAQVIAEYELLSPEFRGDCGEAQNLS